MLLPHATLLLLLHLTPAATTALLRIVTRQCAQVPPDSDCSDDMRGGGWRLDGDLRDDDDCDNLCEDVSELQVHTRLQESNWELSEHQFGDDYDDGMEYDADA